jgi:hypothetical protein
MAPTPSPRSNRLAESLRLLKRGPGRPARRRVAQPAAREAVPAAPRSSQDAGCHGGASKRQCYADPVRAISRFENTKSYSCLDLCDLYLLYALFSIIVFALYYVDYTCYSLSFFLLLLLYLYMSLFIIVIICIITSYTSYFAVVSQSPSIMVSPLRKYSIY